MCNKILAIAILLAVMWVFICMIWLMLGITLFFMNYVVVALSKGKLKLLSERFKVVYFNIGDNLMLKLPRR